MLDKFANNTGRPVNSAFMSALLSAMNSDGADNAELCNNQGENAKHSCTSEVIKVTKKCVSKQDCDKVKPDKSDNKKLVSCKCAKPDETDIKVVVKYPHEKLDKKHVQERSFDRLEFNNLIAGELEIVANYCQTEEEREAQIDIAKILCYHRKYLDDHDLREGYDSIMKQVEQGSLQWTDSLGEKLHNHLDYHANVITRSRIAQESQPRNERRNAAVKTTIDNTKEKVYYCLEYNLGTCPQADNHEGRIGGKRVTKFHICRRCHKEGKYKSHRESDDSCSKKNS